MPVETIAITDRETWLAHRRRDLTASDVAAVAGFDPRRSPLSVYAEKAGLVEGQGDSPIMRRGRWLEPAVLAAIRETYPDWQVRRAAVYLRDPEWRLGATPDAVALIPGVEGVVNLQLKVVAKPVYEHEWTTEQAPIAYEIQTLVEGLLMDAAQSLVVPLVVSTYDAFLGDPRLVPRHPAAEQRAQKLALDFWARIEQRRPPPTDWRLDAGIVEQMHPDAIPDKEIDLSRDNRTVAILEELETLDDVQSAGDERIEALEAELKGKLGDAEVAIVNGWRLSWKVQHKKAGFVAASTSRVLRYRRETP